MIKCLFNEYKDLTLRMIEELEKDEDIKPLMDKRQEVLEEINNVDISPKEKETCYKELLIDKYDKNLEVAIKRILESVKEEINESKIRRKSTNSYAAINRQPNLFSKKV